MAGGIAGADIRVLRRQEIKNLIEWHDRSFTIAQGNAVLWFNDITRLREVFWRTLIGDRSPVDRYAPPTYGEYYRRWTERIHQSWPEGNSNNHDLLGSDIDNPDLITWSEALEQCAMGRRMCVTLRGRIGIVPPGAQLGDEIALIFGATTPFLIRHSGDPCRSVTGGRGCTLPFQLVGECYIHGIMHGEGTLYLSPSKGSMLAFI
jgi:hypothetical protein